MNLRPQSTTVVTRYRRTSWYSRLNISRGRALCSHKRDKQEQACRNREGEHAVLFSEREISSVENRTTEQNAAYAGTPLCICTFRGRLDRRSIAATSRHTEAMSFVRSRELCSPHAGLASSAPNQPSLGKTGTPHDSMDYGPIAPSGNGGSANPVWREIVTRSNRRSP